MKLRAFTLIELLVTTTIITIMALIAIPSFGKNQMLIELQNKTDELKSGITEMQVKALNAEKDKVRYYAKLTSGANGSVEYGSWDGITGHEPVAYKTVNLTNDQTLARSTGPDLNYLVCDKGKNFCCNVTAATSPCVTAMNNVDFFTITSDKTTTFKIFANPFRVTTVTN